MRSKKLTLNGINVMVIEIENADEAEAIQRLRQGLETIMALSGQEAKPCYECGKLSDTRPFGENFEEICFECASKHPERTMAQASEFGKALAQKN